LENREGKSLSQQNKVDFNVSSLPDLSFAKYVCVTMFRGGRLPRFQHQGLPRVPLRLVSVFPVVQLLFVEAE